MNSEYFYYNGVTSSDYNIYLVNVNSGLKNDRFLAEKEIISETVAGRGIPYVYDYKKKPLTLNLTLALIDDKWTYENRQKLARWLDIDEFAKFYCSDNSSKLYYCTYVGGIDLTHNMAEDGYITVTMQCLHPYALSPIYTETFINPIGANIYEFENKGDDTLLPELSITKINRPIENPTVAPTLTAKPDTYTLSSLPAGTYYVRYTWMNETGETLPSPSANFTIVSGEDLVVNTPSLPVNAKYAYIYISNVSGEETKQGEATTTYYQSSPLISGEILPIENTTLNGDLSIINLSNGGAEFKFTGLADNEQLYIDNKNRHIETDIPLTYRHDNFNNNYLELNRGINRLEITGECEITFRYQFIIKG